MLKRLLCTVFLAVFCFGNAAYAISNDAMVKKLQSTLRKDLTGEILKMAHTGCSDAGLETPRNVSISVEKYNSEYCIASLRFSSYVPAEWVRPIAWYVGVSAADILKKYGRCPAGFLILVLSAYGDGGDMYDVQSIKREKAGNLSFASIPVEKFLKALQ